MLHLNYLSILVSDMARSLAFYRLLGLPIPSEADALQGHVEIEVGGLRVAWETEALMEQLNPNWQRPGPAGRVAFAVQADTPGGVDQTVDAVRAQGYGVAAEPFDAPWGQRYATVVDPDGLRVDVFAWL